MRTRCCVVETMVTIQRFLANARNVFRITPLVLLPWRLRIFKGNAGLTKGFLLQSETEYEQMRIPCSGLSSSLTLSVINHLWRPAEVLVWEELCTLLNL